ncbi:MAG TPA: hypothetical protein DCS63_10750 [Elusimicrobia bacterium]|nr:hypothetical protein [Elusimicrobiota bacterium]
MTNMRVEGTYAVFQGTAEVQGNAFSVGGSTLSAQYGKVGIGTSTPSFLLHVSSAQGVGGDLLVISTGSSNVIRMTGAGEIYANKFYGDGSSLTGLAALADHLGNHTATQDLKMQGLSIVNAASGTFTQGVTASSFTATGVGIIAKQIQLSPTLPNIVISSEASPTLGGGVRVSTNMYIVGFASATKFYGDGSGLTGVSGDNLGNHIATTTLNMATFNIVNVASITASAAITTYSTMTVAGYAFSVGGSTLTVREGHVGIGVAAPAMPLEVKNNGATSTFKVNTAIGYGSLYIDGIEMVRMKP